MSPFVLAVASVVSTVAALVWTEREFRWHRAATEVVDRVQVVGVAGIITR